MKAFVYGDVSPNIIDGSSIWLGSIVVVLADLVDEVHVLLKYTPTTTVVTSAFDSLPNVVIHLPKGRFGTMRADGGHSPSSAAAQFESLSRVAPFNLAVVRGMDACLAFSEIERAEGILWSYVTDLPFPPEKLSRVNSSRLERIARNSKRMLSQTEAARSYLEGIAPAAAGRTLLMPPMIPDSAFIDRDAAPVLADGLSLVYSGKFAREWRTDEMLDLPAALLGRGVSATLHVIGNKFQAAKGHKGWHERMRTALEARAADDSAGVVWHGGVDRRKSIEVIASADLGIGWRMSELDSSVEISTKALEYGAAAATPVINRTADHERLYGDDYPFFVSARTTVDELADLIVSRLDRIPAARRRAAKVSRFHSMDAARDRWTSYLRTAIPPAVRGTSVATPTRILVAAHDFKFLGEIIDGLEGDPSVKLTVDRWASLHAHDESASAVLLSNADVVFCEWAGPNLVWYSRNKRPGQKLVARLHGFELRGGRWLSEVDFEAVDTMVFVSEFYRQRALDELPLRASQTVTIPNMVDCADFNRPKNPNARFTLGLVGYVPYLKRPDRALDLLEALIEADPRYTLLIKGRPPWEYPHHWNNRIQRACYLDFFGRVRESSLLRAAVRFDSFSPDIASWMRNVGVMLSPSDHESFHLAPAEGMASGAIPVVWEREGASGVFPTGSIHADLESMVSSVLDIVDPVMFENAGRAAADFARRKWDTLTLQDTWTDLLRPDTAGIRANKGFNQ